MPTGDPVYPWFPTVYNGWPWQQFVPRVVHIPPKRPHKCPVCEGSGFRPPESGLQSEPVGCHACEGKGIVWEPEAL